MPVSRKIFGGVFSDSQVACLEVDVAHGAHLVHLDARGRGSVHWHHDRPVGKAGSPSFTQTGDHLGRGRQRGERAGGRKFSHYVLVPCTGVVKSPHYSEKTKKRHPLVNHASPNI